jgi:hypothetical protein
MPPATAAQTLTNFGLMIGRKFQERAMGMKHVGAAFSLGAAIVLAAASLPAGAATTTLSIDGVSNNAIVCNGPGAPTNENCVYDELARVQCPAGEDPISVTVTIGPTQMETCVDATNTAAFSSCYNIAEVRHEQLELEVAGTLLNGTPPPLNADGSGTTIAALGGCAVGFPETLFTYRRASGGVISQCTILDTTGPAPISNTYTPGDAEFDTFYGDDTVTIPVRFASRADASVEQSGTWDGGVVTSSSGSVTLSLECTEQPNGVPAVGPIGIGALLIGLSGLATFVGFTRRG